MQHSVQLFSQFNRRRESRISSLNKQTKHVQKPKNLKKIVSLKSFQSNIFFRYNHTIMRHKTPVLYNPHFLLQYLCSDQRIRRNRRPNSQDHIWPFAIEDSNFIDIFPFIKVRKFKTTSLTGLLEGAGPPGKVTVIFEDQKLDPNQKVHYFRVKTFSDVESSLF